MKHIHKDLDLSIRPETYKTILKQKYGSNTETFKVRRKMSKLLREGNICSKSIKNLNNGRDRIFYFLQKEYFIVFTKKECYYCDNVQSFNSSIKLINSYKLNFIDWIKKGDIFIDIEEVLICF